MRTLCKLLGLLSLVLIFVFPFVYAFGIVTLALLKQVIFVSTLIWFGTALFWIGKKKPEEPASESIL
ncbi:hypothetical protein ACWPKS_04775 [Coraliomargarita sp. W4R72]